MSQFVLGFGDVDKSKLNFVGGKGANLAELTRINGINVPDGFCISTEAYKRSIEGISSIRKLLDELSVLKADDIVKISKVAGEIRGVIEGISIPRDICEEVNSFLAKLGEKNAYAVRSSATSEDLPTASFAGQQDTYLNIIGKDAIVKHIGRCWASLFTERAVIYRIQNGFDHRAIHLSVIVQRMMFPQVSGVMFTADPVTSNRKALSIDASFGLGEAIVSGLVNPDTYKVRDVTIIDKKISTKKLAIEALKDGGTKEEKIESERQNMQTLTDKQILQLAGIGRKIEEHFGRPQDIEWCLADDIFYIVQSRPITTLFPIPESSDHENRVYISVGHQQMMTDAIKPLGLSFFQLTALRPMFRAGGRLFVDVTQQLSSPAARETLIAMMGQHDPLIKDAVITIIERGDFIKSLPKDIDAPNPGKSNKGSFSIDLQTEIEGDPTIISDLIRSNQQSIEELKQKIQTKSGTDLLDFILEDLHELKKILLDPKSVGAIRTGMNASAWINEKMMNWLGEKNVADTLSQSVNNNVTSEMGFALLDVADVIRNYPKVIEYLQNAQDDDFLDGMTKIGGGKRSKEAISAFLNKYGMRCAGEIDITKPRWNEKRTTLIPIILSNIRNFEPNAGARKFEQGRQEASKKEQELLALLKRLPDGEQKAEETKRMMDVLRNFIAYREYPKYGIVSRYFVYKRALLAEAERLVEANVIHEKEEIYYLSFEELREVVRAHKLDHQVIDERKNEHKLFERLTPPRVITSDGEIITGKYKREDLPADAIVGLPVSAGVVEGRARVILSIEGADLENGDILVTSFTDPSWTPLFIAIKGLVTEVGGLMTHGAVIAREYGLPAIVGVEDATKLIRDGQRIRVDGTEGYIELL